MKEYTAKDIRNIGIFGHGGVGKTSLTEAILFEAGLTDRLGKTDNGTSVTDYDPEEIKRHISINMAVAPIEWNNTKINFIDAPGFFDFYGEVAAAMELADSALILVGAVSGLEVGAEKAMDACAKSNKPRIIVMNQLDRENANFDKCLKTITDKYSSAVPIQLPIMQGGAFKGYVDIIHMEAKMFDGKSEKTVEIPANLADEAQELYEQLNEHAAEADEELMEKYFEDGELSREDIIKGLGLGIKEGVVTPVCCVSALTDTGVATLLNKCIDLLPAADQAPAKAAKDAKTGADVTIGHDGPFAGQVIKTINDQFGKFSIIKVYRGTLDVSVAPYNTTADKAEKPSVPYYMKGKKTYPIDRINAGDIAVLGKLQYTATGDSLSDPSAQVVFPAIDFPAPCISLAVSAKKQGEDDKVISGLNKIREEDPTIRIERNKETGDMLIEGLGEMHIDVVCAKLKNKSNVEAALADPRIPYRETIRGMAEAEGKHKKQSGGSGQFGVVQMRFEPSDDGNFEFVNAIVGGVVPKEFIPAVEKGLVEAMQKGVLAGYPMVGIKATLYDGKYHPVDSKEVAFKNAARLSYKAACVKARPVLIEPIHHYDILVPNDNVGDIIGNLSSRRGKMLGMTPKDGGLTLIEAEAPLSEMFKYATDLRSMTQGRGSFTSEYVRYEDVPSDVAQKIIANAKVEDDDDE